jgi:hypothetical protein
MSLAIRAAAAAGDDASGLVTAISPVSGMSVPLVVVMKLLP